MAPNTSRFLSSIFVSPAFVFFSPECVLPSRCCCHFLPNVQTWPHSGLWMSFPVSASLFCSLHVRTKVGTSLWFHPSHPWTFQQQEPITVTRLVCRTSSFHTVCLLAFLFSQPGPACMIKSLECKEMNHCSLKWWHLRDSGDYCTLQTHHI